MRPAKRWAYRELLPDFSVPGLSALDCRLLAHRGVQDAAQAQAFLGRGYAASTDPFALLDMDRALDIIVTAHPLPGEALPAAAAVLNPKRPGDPYSFKGLSGVGLAYKLVEGLAGALQGPSPQELLDLVAVGTVADLAPLLGENRALVSAGLERLDNTRRQGLLALVETSGFSPGALSASSIAFGLAPRLNAAGPLGP